ncbi:helix-turn-helix domain-containing protein [Hominifimenecus sp. rT4P-3]|uniref:helix-turn-helix domain-containing protein n=1 Tax=Hominifimenecus sp. rT4P-3 TaxID=3242979 RepID=UPI003DA23939
MKKLRAYIAQFVRAFRFNSTFFQTFLVVLILSTLLFGAFCFYSLYRENENLKENVESSYLNMLETTCTATELTLQNMQQLMQQTIWRKEFANALILPTSDDYARTLNIITQLYRLAENYPFIEKAYLYTPSNQMVYSSDLSYLPAEKSKDSLFLNQDALMSYTGARPSEDSNALFIKKLDEHLVLCQHLYPDNIESIGVLIFCFNSSALDLSLYEDDPAISDAFYVFDRQGIPVFSQTVPESAASQAALLLDQNGTLTKGSLQKQDDLLYFYYISPATGWLYLYPADAQTFDFQPSVGRILSLLFLALLLGLLFSLQIAYRANRPIRSLLKELSNSSTDDIEAKNDIDYLTKIYSHATIQNKHLREAIQSITPLVLERLFSDILNGRAPTEESIDASLNSIGQPFPRQSRFLALALEVSSKQNAELSVLEMNLHLLQIRDLLPRILPVEYQSCLVSREGQSAILILIAPPETNESDIQQTIFQLTHALQKMTQATAYQIETGCGNIYNRIADVRYSYLEAQKNLNRKRFYGEEDGEMEQEGLPSQNPYLERINQIFSYIQADNAAKALELAEQMIEEIAASNLEPVLAKRQYHLFLQTLIETTDTLHIGNMESLLRKKVRLDSSLEQYATGKELQAAIRAFCHDVIGSIDNKNKKKSFQHVVRIKEYIHANYSDSNLSLYTAAEQTGISPSYLSRLFKQEIGTSFVDYVNDFRVEKAKHFLESTDLLIKDIAYQTGFNSMQNFFRIFKKLTGVSPGEYRQNQGNTP